MSQGSEQCYSGQDTLINPLHPLLGFTINSAHQQPTRLSLPCVVVAFALNFALSPCRPSPSLPALFSSPAPAPASAPLCSAFYSSSCSVVVVVVVVVH